jgi:hypothetical protein
VSGPALAGDKEELDINVRGTFIQRFFLPDASVHVGFRSLARAGKLVLRLGER